MNPLVEQMVRLDQKIAAAIARAEAVGDPVILADIPELQRMRDELQLAKSLMLWNAPESAN